MLPRKRLDPDPDSPCVRNCCLDEADVCLGCGRSLAEILGWHKADADARARIREQAAERLRQRRERFRP